MASTLRPYKSDGLHPDSDGLQPTSDGLEHGSCGLTWVEVVQSNSLGPVATDASGAFRGVAAFGGRGRSWRFR